jgi:BirA family biotin operon repressor/biotin-[acetyl-CoA-carboxylase] ligase
MGTDHGDVSKALDADALRQSLHTPWSRLDVVETSESTNAALLAAAPDALSGQVLAAEHQLAGRGRLGRTWSSPPRAGLTFSVLLRPTAPPSSWGWLPLLTGLAVGDAVSAGTGLNARVKWPNDVLVGPDERKIAGILVQINGGAVVIGIGLNANLAEADLPVPTASSLLIQTGAAVDRTELLCEVLGELGSRYQLWDAAGGNPAAAGLAADYRDRCSTLGRMVTVTQTDGATIQAKAIDVDETGRLVLQVGDERQVLAAGDVHHVR